MNEAGLLISTIVLVATFASVLFVLLVQRRRAIVLSARQLTWENAQKRSLQIWKVQQEKRVIEFEKAASIRTRQLETAWKAWEATNASLVADTAQEAHDALLRVKLEQEIARIPRTDDVPL